MSRYNSRLKLLNNEDLYKEVKEDRGVRDVIQYETPVLKFPTEEEFRTIQTIDYTWSQGDQFWRLASSQYGDPTLWWVIAQFNRKPTEGHLSPGDVIKLPINIGDALGVLL